MRIAAVLIAVGVLLWNVGVVAAAATEQECEAMGGEWAYHCWMPPSPPQPLSWAEIWMFGMMAVLFCGFGWMLRFA